jgi:hypothetical protein
MTSLLRIVSFISLLVLSACGNSTSNEELPQGNEVSIAHLKSLCTGEHHRIVENLTIRGVVVGTGWLGELHNSAIIVDESGGIEIAIEATNLIYRLPIYAEVSISCNGLMLARIGSKIELGAASSGDFPLANIDDEMFDWHIRIEGACDTFTPTTKRFSEIDVDDISNIFRFDNVQFAKEERGLLWCDLVENEPVMTYRTLVDAEGDTLHVRTLPSCQYAREKLPSNRISVIGVIDNSDNRYFLKVVNKWFTEL